jgi:hypothetical protein
MLALLQLDGKVTLSNLKFGHPLDAQIPLMLMGTP